MHKSRGPLANGPKHKPQLEPERSRARRRIHAIGDARLTSLPAASDATHACSKARVQRTAERSRARPTAERDAVIAELRARLDQNSRNSSRPPSSDGYSKPPANRKRSLRWRSVEEDRGVHGVGRGGSRGAGAPRTARTAEGNRPGGEPAVGELSSGMMGRQVPRSSVSGPYPKGVRAGQRLALTGHSRTPKLPPVLTGRPLNGKRQKRHKLHACAPPVRCDRPQR